MRIRALADQLGTTPHAIRFYERKGFLPAPKRGANRYREYGEADADRLRLLVGLRQLDLPLEQAAELAGMCAEGRCAEVSTELRAAISEKRSELRRRMQEMSYLDRRLAHLEGDLAAGEPPRPLIALGKEVHGDAL
jgi:putative AdoMet-dependent methyltransferase